MCVGGLVCGVPSSGNERKKGGGGEGGRGGHCEKKYIERELLNMIVLL